MKKIKKILWIYIRFIQKILITILLSITYFSIVPLSLLFMCVFRPRQVFKNIEIKESYWVKNSAFQHTLDEYKEQS